jgi:hypothetical protein
MTAKPLEFGIAYHAAAEHWYNPETWNIDNESRELETILVFKKHCMDQMDDYKKKHLPEWEVLDDEIVKDYDERVELGFAMLKQMFTTSYEIDEEYRPVGVEVPFEVPIKDSDGNDIWCKCQRCWKKYVAFVAKQWSDWEAICNDGESKVLPPKPSLVISELEYRGGSWKIWMGLPVTLGGRIDALFQDKYGRYWIVDWKTAARLSVGEPGSPDDFLWLDDQITSYCWALWLLGIDVAGFIYHEQKKAMLEEPEPMSRRYKGCLYSQNKQKNFDATAYEATVKIFDPEAYHAGLYTDFIFHLQTDVGAFYKRHTIHRNENELIEAGINIALEALDMTDPNLRIYPSPGRFACGYCAFKEPCLGKNRGEDYVYTLDTMFEKRTKLYYETAAPNTDKPSRS